MFERIRWESSHLTLGGITFDLMRPSGRLDDREERPCLVKDRKLIRDYERLFDSCPITPGSRIFEAGLYDGASAIFWTELLDPALYLGVDLGQPPNDVLEAYVARRDLGNQLIASWGVDQSDGATLRAIVAQHDGAPLDLIIDDASHMYEPTKATFEALFPLLRVGGIYVIEDWAWEHWATHGSPYHQWAFEESPTRLAVQLVEATGTNQNLIERVDIFGGLIAAHRGPAVIDEPFSLDRTIRHRHRARAWHRPLGVARRKIGTVRRGRITRRQ